MTDKELKKLTRRELLEMLLDQSKEMEKLKKELEQTKVALKNRKIAIDTSGSLAEAALKLSGVFEKAQKAADLYLDNIKGAVEKDENEI